jgi:hypothetical protein
VETQQDVEVGAAVEPKPLVICVDAFLKLMQVLRERESGHCGLSQPPACAGRGGPPTCRGVRPQQRHHPCGQSGLGGGVLQERIALRAPIKTIENPKAVLEGQPVLIALGTTLQNGQRFAPSASALQTQGQ